jgi:hypothetical protein
MSNRIISEGRSYAYLAHALFLAIGIAIAAVYLPIVLISLVIPVGLFLASTGVEIDINGKRFRRYTKLFGVRRGIWLPADHFVSARLVEYRSGKRMLGVKRYGYTSSKTFDILLINRSGEEFELNDFLDYENAVNCLQSLNSLGLETKNVYAEETARALSRKNRRR